MIRTKKYAARMRVSTGVIGAIVYSTAGFPKRQQTSMNTSELQTLLEQLARGDIDAASAHQRVLDALRATPFADLGFARVDHHRAIRQGFPEVVLGIGKTPAQIAAIAAEIVSRGSTLLITRATEAA